VTTDARASSDGALRREIAALGPWFHNLHLPDGTQTEPWHPLGDFPATKWNHLAPHLPRDLTGWTALDIGCNAGFYTFELARRGAHVTAIDVDPHYLDQARWAARRFGLEDRVELRRMQVYDLARTAETWDLVLFMGVLYHLRYPMLGLDIVTAKVRRRLIFQTLTMPGTAVHEDVFGLEIDHREPMLEPGWPKLAFIEHDLAGDPTNWWAPNHAAVEAMLRSSGMKVVAPIGHEMYVAEPDPDHPSPMRTWNQSEFLSAIGSDATGG
jgi:tRNA (mo5U34)-methyltransferase